MNSSISIRVGFIAILFLHGSFLSASQTAQITGIISNAETHEPLQFASVRVEGTSMGTTTDKFGRYTLSLSPGSWTIIATFIGFSSTRSTVQLKSQNIVLDMQLVPGHIELSPVTVTPSDNPALEIIRKAIVSREKRRERLLNYRLSSHSKLVVKANGIKGIAINGFADSTVTVIMETQTDAVWARPDRYKETVTARKQSAFIPAQSNILISSFFITDFSSELLKLNDKGSIIGPISNAGLRNYDYSLRGSTSMDGERVYIIDIAPLSENDPLLNGTLFISDGTFALAAVDVSLNAAARPTFFTALRFQQHFNFIGSEFWMPTDVIVEADVRISMIVGINLHIEGFSVLQDYVINDAANETVFDRTRVKILKEADERDSTYWSRNQKIPNTSEELADYRASDSIKAMMRANQNNYALGNIVTGKTIVYDDMQWTVPGVFEIYQFNRVSGHELTLHSSLLNSNSWFHRADAAITYEFGGKRVRYQTGLSVRPLDSRQFAISASIYDKLSSVTENNDLLGSFGTTCTNLFWKYDEKDYFSNHGFAGSVFFDLFLLFPTTFTFEREIHRSALITTDWSIMRRQWRFRSNPAINDGMETRIGIRTRFDDRDFIDNAGSIRRFGRRKSWPEIEYQHVVANLNGRNLKYDIIGVVIDGTLDVGRFGSFLYRLCGWMSTNALPTQSLLRLPGSIPWISDRLRFRNLDVIEFGGDKIGILFIEQEFGDQLFRWLHIPILESSGIGLVVFGSAGWASMMPATLAMQTIPTVEVRIPQYEVGVGLDHLFELFRVDAAWRLNHFRTGRNFFIGISTPILH